MRRSPHSALMSAPARSANAGSNGANAPSSLLNARSNWQSRIHRQGAGAVHIFWMTAPTTDERLGSAGSHSAGFRHSKLAADRSSPPR